MATQNEEYDGVDALMAAITGEPVPQAARADAAYMAEHRAATAHVALLREQLGIIGEALSEPPPRPEPAPVRAPRPARRRRPALRALAFGTLAIAVVAGMITGLSWLVAHNGGVNDASSSSADSKAADGAGEGSKSPGPLSDPELYVACSSLLVEGTVTGVQPSSDPRKRITLAVTRSYRPAHGPADVTVVLAAGATPAPRQGQHVLVGVPKGAHTATLWAVGDDAVAADRAAIVGALTGAGTGSGSCPTG
ncbi:hypothetical protein R6V09_16005 [Streptomyces sp. W16]|uniref:hypothetical protein n=1 Tax=Streptomyces sp. W16 TaxID=3076631 RepID=UPI00295B4B56|nr:hypothetical protein [Streptomyces sp. W16]MDV9171618.1 hypothetical protein [Streptomyces sp. W16]